MKYFKSILLFLIVVSCNDKNEHQNEATTDDETFHKFTAVIDQYVQNGLQKGNVNSFALAIYKNGEKYHNYYGEIDKGAKNKPNDSSLFEIASITKTFTGSLVAKAVLASKISLEDDIRKYLEDDYPNLEFQGHPITIKDLLTHSMGLKNKLTKGFEAMREKVVNGTYNSENDSYTIGDLLQELKTVEVNKIPGTTYAYNSLGPELLAYILEKVNKKPFKEQMDTFFKQLGMNDTYIDESLKHKNRLVRGYKGDTLVSIDFDPVYGAAGGAISTLPDMANYMQFLINNKETPWIKEASRSLFVDEEDGEHIGYLWQNIDYGKEEGYYYSKTGTSNAIQSGILICPDSNYGIVLMINNTSNKAINDWATLFFTEIEPDLIKYPKLNLFSILKDEFKSNPKQAISKYRELKMDTTAYFSVTKSINSIGYELLNKNKEEKALEVFKFITQEFPENANAYDSLGEAYFVIQDYKNALLNYKKSLELNPNNDNAKVYITKIEELNNKNNE